MTNTQRCLKLCRRVAVILIRSVAPLEPEPRQEPSRARFLGLVSKRARVDSFAIRATGGGDSCVA
jgi:hypothetical protein